MKPNIDRNALSAHLCAEFGSISNLKELTEGEDSRVFGFHSGEDALIVRLNSSPNGFLKDKLAHSRFHADALPVPEIVSIDRFGPFSLCISRRAEGQSLQQLGTPSAPVLAAVADTLAALARADVSFTRGFGPIDARGVAAFASWRDFLLAPTGFDWSATSESLDLMEVPALLAALERLVRHCPEVRGLVHGDFGSNNVLVSGTQVTGVIDWSEALIGDPCYDLANIFFWRSWLDCMEAQANHAVAAGLPVDVEPILICYQLRIGLQEAFSAAMAGDARMAGWAVARCAALA